MWPIVRAFRSTRKPRAVGIFQISCCGHLHHALRYGEQWRLRIKDVRECRGVQHLRIYDKSEKLRNTPHYPVSLDRITDNLKVACHGALPSAPLFRPIRNNRRGRR